MAGLQANIRKQLREFSLDISLNISMDVSGKRRSSMELANSMEKTLPMGDSRGRDGGVQPGCVGILGASGCGKNETDRAGKTTSFFFHF